MAYKTCGRYLAWYGSELPNTECKWYVYRPGRLWGEDQR
jgi:hypothetical protein